MIVGLLNSFSVTDKSKHTHTHKEEKKRKKIGDFGWYGGSCL
jgi:hypothetical protein